MIVRRLLTTESKRNIKEVFKTNPVYRTINAAYKEQESQMKTLRFSPEEIWVNCFIGFDHILKNRDSIAEVTFLMWHDIFCELRDDAKEASREFEENELKTATSCILYSIISCMLASGDMEMIKYTDLLSAQISMQSDLPTICLPFINHIEDNFLSYIQKYISTGKYISNKLVSPKSYADPINPIYTPQERIKAKVGVLKRLEFMKGYLPDSETLIMTSSNFNTMIEAAEFLIENDVVKKQETKLHTNMPVAHLRYTFYLVYKNEGKSVGREKWLEFLGETFAQMQDNKASIKNHFSDIPKGYNIYSKQKKKK